MAVTLKDIADRVGKSVPTVSRALAGHNDIALETRQQVQAVASELGYVPNTIARKLQKQRTDTIALILPSTANLRFSDPFFSQLLSGFVDQTSRNGFELTISATQSTAAADAVDTYLSFVRGRHVDGFIVVRTERQDARIDLLRRHKVPFVAFGRTEHDNDFAFVDEAGAEGMTAAVDHLVALGHRRIAYITEPTHLTKAFHRLQGFQQGMQKNNLIIRPDYLIETRFRQPSGRAAMEQLLTLADPPTAIAAANDLLAIGAIQFLNERGIKVGRDMSVIGFDNIAMAEMTTPGLTTLNLPAVDMGAQIAKTLIDVILGRTSGPKQTIVVPTLVVRGSTGPAPAG